MSTTYYMACLDLRGRSCLVVGGATVATEPAVALLICDAAATLVAPENAEHLRGI